MLRSYLKVTAKFHGARNTTKDAQDSDDNNCAFSIVMLAVITFRNNTFAEPGTPGP